MKDAFGQTLELGDRVVTAHISSGSVYFHKEYVTGFTPKMVRVSRDPEGTGTARKPDKCVRITEW